MDYTRYKQFRSELPKDRYFLRLDCMNPVQALSPWIDTMPKRELEIGVSRNQVVLTWAKFT